MRLLRQMVIEIADFNYMYFKESNDAEDNYINLHISLEDDQKKFDNESSPFKSLIQTSLFPISNNYKEINIRLRINPMIEMILEYLFMSSEELSQYTGTITPLQYKIKLIKTLGQLDE